MRDDSERIRYAQWVLERTLAFISAAEVKVSVIVTINLAMLGGMGGAFMPTQSAVRGWPLYFSVVAYILLAASLIGCAWALIPRTKGPEKSYVFFDRIGKSPQKAYFTDFSQAGEDAILKDLLAQIHINSQIACKKYASIRICMILSFVSIIPWSLSMFILMYK